VESFFDEFYQNWRGELAFHGQGCLWIGKWDLDFVQIHYSIFERGVEDRILPAAAERGTAVLVNMPFEKARLFEIVRGQPLPDFVREIGCENWAQFFLKYVISHPAVTAAIPATTNPAHVIENMGALRGSLPNNQMRTRMVQHMPSLPGFERIAQMPWYPGKQFAGLVRLPGLAATQAESDSRENRDGTSLSEGGWYSTTLSEPPRRKM